METQKTSNSQSDMEKKETKGKESGSLTSDTTTKLSSLKQYGTGIKTEKQINGTGQKSQK